MNRGETITTRRRRAGYLPRLPRSLSAQLLLFTALSLIVAILTYAGYSANRQSQLASKTMAGQMSALARSLAEVNVGNVVRDNLGDIESVVARSADFPEVLSILVVNAAGKPLSEVLHRDGRITSRYSNEPVTPPAGGISLPGADDDYGFFASWYLMLEPDAKRIVWQSISGGTLLGWVRVTYSLNGTRELILRAWTDAFLFSGLSIGVALFLLILLLRSPMRALDNATRFAGQLDQNLGGQIPVSSVVAEFEALDIALNSVSSRLKFQDSALQESVRYTQHILDHVIDGIITFDGGGAVQSFNLSATKIFGYAAGEVTGKNVRMLMPDPNDGDYEGFLFNDPTTETRKNLGKGREVIGRRKDGGLFSMDIAVSVSSHLGAPLFIAIVRDISERKRLDQIKKEFISIVSHELRTPLTSISGSLALIAGGVAGDLPATAKTLVDVAHRNSKRLILLVNDILDTEKIESGQMEFDMQTTGLMPLLKHAVEANQAYAEQLHVHFLLENELPGATLRVDANRMLQVCTNLLSNAAKFSNAGGTVRIAVERIDGRIRVSVKDNGPGIPDEFKERIFQKFAQADSSDTRKMGGTGLGLSISKAMVERMGGSIGFDSQPNVLTRFYVEFPEHAGARP